MKIEEILERHKKMCIDSCQHYPDYFRVLNSEFIHCFFKDVECEEIYFRDAEHKFFDKKYFSYLYTPIIEKGKQIALLDNTLLEFISKYKRIELNLKRNDPAKNLGAQNALEMIQSTDNGLYYFVLKDYVYLDTQRYYCHMYYFPNQPQMNIGTDKPFILLPDQYAIVRDKILTITEKDIPMIANMIYKNGLPHLCEIFKSGGTIEITDDDRKYYKFTSEQKDEMQTIQNLPSENNPTTLEEDSNDLTEVSRKQNKIIEQLINLKNMGLELSPDQETLISLYDKLNSEKFKQFKETAKIRLERQQAEKDRIAEENQKKEQWHNSPENPTNKRIEELNHMKKQIQGLQMLQNIDDSLLTDDQRDFIKKGKIFFEMLSYSQFTTMDPEIRNWYQSYYESDDITPKK